MFYAAGDYAARKGVDVGFITLHPSGLPHGPQPGAVEKALGKPSTDELAVMWDTFRPLRLAALWRDVDKPDYAYCWNPDRAAAPGAEPGADCSSNARRSPSVGPASGIFPRPRAPGPRPPVVPQLARAGALADLLAHHARPAA